jgi:hypothetical protein
MLVLLSTYRLGLHLVNRAPRRASFYKLNPFVPRTAYVPCPISLASHFVPILYPHTQ